MTSTQLNVSNDLFEFSIKNFALAHLARHNAKEESLAFPSLGSARAFSTASISLLLTHLLYLEGNGNKFL
jgi:hypothetical protein